MTDQIFRRIILIVGFLLSTISTGQSQTYQNLTRVDIVEARAIVLAAQRTFGDPRQNLQKIRLSSASLDVGATYHVEITSAAETAAFDVSPDRNAVTKSVPRAAGSSAMTLPGKLLLALLLSDRELASSASKSSWRDRSDVVVQMNVPYPSLPNTVFVWYFPKVYKKRTPPQPGCDPTVGFNVDAASGKTVPLKAPC